MARKSSHRKLTRAPTLPAPRTELQARFVERLESVLGSQARVILANALRATRRGEVPSDPNELLTFARANLTGAIIDAVGARGVGRFLTEVERDVAELESHVRGRARPSAKQPRIALVEEDAEARGRLSAVLSDFGFEVESLDDIRALTLLDPPPNAIVLDLSEGTIGPLLFSLSSFKPEVEPLIVIRTAKKRVEVVRLLHAARLRDCEIVPSSAPDSDLIALLSPLRSALRP
jgi:CheY-like chemotaxis protein